LKKSRSLLSWLVIFLAGFVAGIVFSAWKLDTSTGPAAPSSGEAAQGSKTELANRIVGLEEMLAKTPDNVEARIQLGNDYFDSRNYEKAVEAYQKAVKINPKNADVITDMGIAYRRLGKHNEAVEAFKRAVGVDPGHAVALFNLGIVYRDDLKNLPAAIKAWEAFLEKAGDAPHAVMVRPWLKRVRDQLAKGASKGKDQPRPDSPPKP